MPDILDECDSANPPEWLGTVVFASTGLSNRPAIPMARIGLPVFRNTIRKLLDCPPEYVTELHRQAIDRLCRSVDSQPYIEALLDLCVEARSEGGLDVATDVLAQAGDLALHHAQDFRRTDAVRWSCIPTIGYHPNDDKWVVLIRAATQSNVNHPDLPAFLQICVSSGNRSIREAAVEGLAAIGSLHAKNLIERIAEHDPDPLIRRCAQGNLE